MAEDSNIADELEKLLTAKDSEIATKDKRISELEINFKKRDEEARNEIARLAAESVEQIETSKLEIFGYGQKIKNKELLPKAEADAAIEAALAAERNEIEKLIDSFKKSVEEEPHLFPWNYYVDNISSGGKNLKNIVFEGINDLCSKINEYHTTKLSKKANELSNAKKALSTIAELKAPAKLKLDDDLADTLKILKSTYDEKLGQVNQKIQQNEDWIKKRKEDTPSIIRIIARRRHTEKIQKYREITQSYVGDKGKLRNYYDSAIEKCKDAKLESEVFWKWIRLAEALFRIECGFDKVNKVDIAICNPQAISYIEKSLMRGQAEKFDYRKLGLMHSGLSASPMLNSFEKEENNVKKKYWKLCEWEYGYTPHDSFLEAYNKWILGDLAYVVGLYHHKTGNCENAMKFFKVAENMFNFGKETDGGWSGPRSKSKSAYEGCLQHVLKKEAQKLTKKE